MVLTSKFWLLARWLQRSSLHFVFSSIYHCIVIHLRVFTMFCVVLLLFPCVITGVILCLMALLCFLTSLGRETFLQEVLITAPSHLVVLISDPFASVNAMFFDEMNLMIAEAKYLEKILDIRILIDISEMSSLISKITHV